MTGRSMMEVVVTRYPSNYGIVGMLLELDGVIPYYKPS